MGPMRKLLAYRENYNVRSCTTRIFLGEATSGIGDTWYPLTDPATRRGKTNAHLNRTSPDTLSGI